MSKVMISIANELLQLIDESAKKEHRSRSEFIREASRVYLRINQTGDRLTRRTDPQILQAIKIQDEIAQKDSTPSWDSVQEIRHWRESR